MTEGDDDEDLGCCGGRKEDQRGDTKENKGSIYIWQHIVDLFPHISPHQMHKKISSSFSGPDLSTHTHTHSTTSSLSHPCVWVVVVLGWLRCIAFCRAAARGWSARGLANWFTMHFHIYNFTLVSFKNVSPSIRTQSTRRRALLLCFFDFGLAMGGWLLARTTRRLNGVKTREWDVCSPPRTN